jgi:chromate reductase
MGASTGMSGTVRAQMHFRQTCVFTNMLPLNRPQVFVAEAAKRFSSEGQLLDETSREFVRLLMQALLDWTRKLHYGGLMVELGNTVLPVTEPSK